MDGGYLFGGPDGAAQSKHMRVLINMWCTGRGSLLAIFIGPPARRGVRLGAAGLPRPPNGDRRRAAEFDAGNVESGTDVL